MKTTNSEKYRALVANPDRYSSMEIIHAHTFVENVVEARECGFSLVCAECGVGISDESDEHEDWCEMKAKEEAALAKFKERLGEVEAS